MNPPESSITRSSFFGPILFDEMVWSYFARILAHFPSMSLATLTGILGDEVPSHRKTFPTKLANLAAAFNFPGAPDAIALVRWHTFWLFALPEISAADGDLLMRTMVSDSFPVGAPDSLLLPADFKLRMCPSCISEGKNALPYWRCSHQVPTLRICTIHKTPLVETNILAGTQQPVPATQAVPIGPFEVVDMKAQQVLAAAYRFLANAAVKASADQVGDELIRTLQRHGRYSSRQVHPELTELLRQSFHHESLAAVRLTDHSVSLRDWITVPKVALVLAALGEPFHEFMTRAFLAKPAVKWANRHEAAMARERELAGRVYELAPRVAADIKRAFPFRPVTRWSLANALNRFLGPSFASNWSYKGAIKDELESHAESDVCYANRVIEAIVEDPEVCLSFDTFAECMGAFGLLSFMRRRPDMARQIRIIFKEVHGRG